MRPEHDRPWHGFTLLEVLVAITLLGLVALIAVPRVASTTRAHEVTEEARYLHERLAIARTQAIAERTDYRVRVIAGNSIEVERWDGTTWTSVLVSGDFDAEIEVDGASDGAIVMQARGMVDAPRTFRVERDEHDAVVRVLASGLILWEEES